MKNKINYLFLVLLLPFLANCERDDICIDATTPHLIIRFYDNLNTNQTKNVNNLAIFIESDVDDIQIGSIITATDSITIPLSVIEDFTKIRLSKNTTDDSGIIDEFTLNYTRNEIFVSRSCGFKTIYQEVQSSGTTNEWIENISIINTTIENEQAAHISIFH